MNIEVLKNDKNDVELKVDNLTIAEILRVYMYQQGIDFAAWRREHPSKPLIFKMENSGDSVKKVVGNAVSAIKDDCDKILKVINKK